MARTAQRPMSQSLVEAMLVSEVIAMTTVRDVMTPSVISISPTMPLKDVARKLLDARISGAPVVDGDGRVLGVVSETDFLTKEAGAGAVRHRPLAALLGESDETRVDIAKIEATTAGEAMTAPAITIDADASLAAAATLMRNRSVNRLPVTDGGILAGIVTRADLLATYARSDDQLAEAIRHDVLREALWLDPGAFEVTVSGGIVRIGGSVSRRSVAELIKSIAKMVPGVIAVESAVTWAIDDRDIEAPEKDLLSPYTLP